MNSEQREALIAKGIEAGDSDEPLQLDVATISGLLADSERAEQLERELPEKLANQRRALCAETDDYKQKFEKSVKYAELITAQSERLVTRVSELEKENEVFRSLVKCVEKLPVGIEMSYDGTNYWVWRNDEDSEWSFMVSSLAEGIARFAKKLSPTESIAKEDVR